MASNRVVVQEGYELPFSDLDGYRRKRRRKSRKSRARRSGGRSRMISKMKSCAKRWRHHRGGGSYRTFMKKCLKK